MKSEEDRKRERRESNTASAKRSRERQKENENELKGQFKKNADRISALERTVDELSSELRKKPSRKPSNASTSSRSKASGTQRPPPGSSNSANVDKDRPDWFGDPF